MGTLSIWHWLIVLAIFLVAFAGFSRRRAKLYYPVFGAIQTNVGSSVGSAATGRSKSVALFAGLASAFGMMVEWLTDVGSVDFPYVFINYWPLLLSAFLFGVIIYFSTRVTRKFSIFVFAGVYVASIYTIYAFITLTQNIILIPLLSIMSLIPAYFSQFGETEQSLEAMLAFDLDYTGVNYILGNFHSQLTIVVPLAVAALARAGRGGTFLVGTRQNFDIGYGGNAMTSERQEVTRLALAAAVLKGTRFRQRLLEKFKYRYSAIAPEGTLDVPLLLGVCKALERREFGFRLTFAFIVVIAVAAALAQSLGLFLFAVLATAPVWLFKRHEEHFVIAKMFSADEFSPEATAVAFPREQTPEAVAAAKGDVNVHVYKGFTPFSFAGDIIQRVSFTVDLSKGEQGQTPKEVTVGAVYNAVTTSLTSGNPDGIWLKDCLFVAGQDVQGVPSLLPDRFGRPVHHVSPGDMAQWVGGKDSRVRHYKWLAISDWSGELIVSYFLRFSIKGVALHCEITQSVLTPFASDVRLVDRLPSLSLFQKVSWFLGVGAAAPFVAVGSAMESFAKLNQALTEAISGGIDQRLRKQIARNPIYDYGAELSLRSELASHSYLHYFQRMDSELYEKALERRILDATIDCLEAHGVDVSTLKDSRSTIINSGVLVQGGDVTAQSLAVGSGAKASVVKQARNLTSRIRGSQKEAA